MLWIKEAFLGIFIFWALLSLNEIGQIENWAESFTLKILGTSLKLIILFTRWKASCHATREPQSFYKAKKIFLDFRSSFNINCTFPEPHALLLPSIHPEPDRTKWTKFSQVPIKSDKNGASQPLQFISTWIEIQKISGFFLPFRNEDLSTQAQPEFGRIQ